MSLTIVTSGGLSAVNISDGYPVFSVKYFLPIYDQSIDPVIHSTDNSIVTSAVPLSGASLVSTTHNTLTGEKIWNFDTSTSAYIISDDNFHMYKDTGGSFSLNTYTNSTMSNSTTVNLLSGADGIHPLSDIVSGNETPTITSANAVDGSNFIWSTTPNATVSANNNNVLALNYQNLWDGVSYTPSTNDLDPLSATAALFHCTIPNSSGDFKFNKVALYVQKVLPTGASDTNEPPILFGVSVLNNTIEVTNDVDGVQNFTLDVKLQFSVDNLTTNTVYYDSDYWYKLPPAVSSPYGLFAVGDVAIGTSANNGSWNPNAKLHLTDSEKPQLILSKTYHSDQAVFEMQDNGGLRITTSAGGPLLSVGLETSAIGNYSIASGQETSASGTHSFASGYQTLAGGDQSFTFGTFTSADGRRAVSFGNTTRASGANSIASGYQSEAHGEASYALGYQTTARGYYSTALGQKTSAVNVGCVAMGRETSAIGNYSTALGKTTQANGDHSLAGGFETCAVGDESFTFGKSTTAFGHRATAFGNTTRAYGVNSLTQGINTYAYAPQSVAFGDDVRVGIETVGEAFNTLAIGKNNWARGNQTIMGGSNNNTTDTSHNSLIAGEDNRIGSDGTNKNAFIVGQDNKVFASQTAIMGSENLAYGQNSFVGGFGSQTGLIGSANSTATGVNSIAFGSNVNAYGAQSFVFGKSSLASNDESIAFGLNNRSEGIQSAVFGSSVTAEGEQSFAIGSGSTAKGNKSFAGGSGSISNGNMSFAFGNQCVATGIGSQSFGDGTITTGNYSQAFGENNQALAGHAQAFGENTIASANYSHTFGKDVSASNRAEFAYGTGKFTGGTGSGHAQVSRVTMSDELATAGSSFTLTINNITANGFKPLAGTVGMAKIDLIIVDQFGLIGETFTASNAYRCATDGTVSLDLSEQRNPASGGFGHSRTLGPSTPSINVAVAETKWQVQSNSLVFIVKTNTAAGQYSRAFGEAKFIQLAHHT